MKSITNYPFNVNELVSSFANDISTAAEDRTMLVSFLRARPIRLSSAASSFMGNEEQRIDFARELGKFAIREGIDIGGPSFFWAFLMIASLDQFPAGDDVSARRTIATMNMVVGHFAVLLKTFLTKPIAESLLASFGHEVKAGGECVYHSVREADKCLLRDRSRCLVTGASYPDACHIFPFSSLRHPQRTSRSLDSTLFFLWGDDCRARLKQLLVGQNNIVDTASNMLALDPRLHRLWAKGIIAFQPIALMENGVRLRFRWMKRTSPSIWENMDATAFVALDPREVLIQPQSEGSLVVRNAETGRPILDGEIIDVTSHDKSIIPNFEILQFQWDLLRMACLSGVAEAVDQGLYWDPKFDDLESWSPFPQYIESEQPMHRPQRDTNLVEEQPETQQATVPLPHQLSNSRDI